MELVPAKTPKLVKSLFPSYVWDIPSKDKIIYLTFDDGPTPEITNWTLDVLDQFNAKATFFCIGSNIKSHPDIFKNIISKGHTIGNHTFTHLKGWRTSTKLYVEDVIKTQELINSHHASNSLLFRPPYGKLIPKQAKALQNLGYSIVMWNVLSFDWDSKVSHKKCLSNVLNHSKSGSIIVFHDSLKAESNLKYTLPKVLEFFSNKGFRFKGLDL